MTMHPGGRTVVWLFALLLVPPVRTPDLHAQDRLVRRFAGEHGLAVPPVAALAQDRTGFLWIGTEGGLYRYDGVEFRRWAPDRIVGSVFRLATADDGRIAGQMEDGAVFELTADGVAYHPAASGGWPATRRTVAFDAAGRLWSVAGDGAAIYRGPGQAVWTAVSREELGGESARIVRRGAGGGVYVLTDAGLWQVEDPGARPRKRFDAALWDLLAFPDGRLVLLTSDSRVLELAGGGVRELASRAAGDVPYARPIALAERNGTIWVSFDRFLLAVRPDEPPELIGTDDGLESGGPLLVDHEGSLWMGSFTALFQYPEPETRVWNDRHGLPSRHTRFLARTNDGLWVTTWQGTGRVRRTEEGFAVSTVAELASQSRPCTDSLGVVWLSGHEGLARLRGDSVIGRGPPRAPFHGCAAAPGGLWIGTERGLLHADAARGTLSEVGGLPFGDGVDVHAVLEDRQGRLWAASFERICHASAAAVVAGQGGWICETVPGLGSVAALVQLPGGTLWAATRRAAILARDADGWRPVPAAAGLPGRNVFALVPSPSGGLWVAGHGLLLRVRPQDDGLGGWEVLENLGTWNGVPTTSGSDLAEDADGTIWITTSLGILRVSPGARFDSAGPPRVVLVDAWVGADPLPLDRGAVHPLELPSERNRLELRFAALSFREPGSVRYQVRLAPDAPWSDTRGQPSFRWVDLPAGAYHAEVRASLDGRTWSATPAGFAFRVLPPWYRTPWALGLFGVLGGGVLWAGYRTRLAVLLGLERQRTRIAMDLHDELGSGLGSMGILAGLLAGDRLEEPQRRRIAGEVAATAGELGSALTDIVWSLDRRAATLEELAGRLAGHGERLFAGDDVEFTLRPPPAWPPVLMPLSLRRSVLLIGLEALHNAARHADAHRVVLAFARRGRRWELSVSDDGVGLADAGPGDARRGGRGLPGMRRRAEEIGADIEVGGNAGRGTTVTLRFRLPGRLHHRFRALRVLFRRRRPRRSDSTAPRPR